MPEYVMGARTAYIGQETYLFPLSVRDNLLFGLKHRPVAPAELRRRHAGGARGVLARGRAGRQSAARSHRRLDRLRAGRRHRPGRPAAAAWSHALKQVEFDEDIYSLGLRGAIDAGKRPDLAEKILKVRHVLHGRLQDPGYAALVEPFNADRYNKNLSVAENLLFGTPVGKDFDGDNLAADPYMQTVLKQLGLDRDLLRMGLSIAETMVELFSGLSPDNPLFEQYSFISADELPNVRLLLQRLGGKGVEAVPEADRVRLMTLPLRYVEARHRLGLIDAAMEDRLLAARRAFARRACPTSLRGVGRVLRFRQIQQRRHPAGQHPVRPPGLRPGAGRCPHRHADPRGAGRARPAQFGDRGRPRLQCRRGRQAPAADASARSSASPGR